MQRLIWLYCIFAKTTDTFFFGHMKKSRFVTPPVFSQSQLSAPRVALKAVPRLFWMFSQHVEAQGKFSVI